MCNENRAKQMLYATMKKNAITRRPTANEKMYYCLKRLLLVKYIANSCAESEIFAR